MSQFEPAAPGEAVRGLRPRAACETDQSPRMRRFEILAAMVRFSQADQHIPLEWALELHELNCAR